MTWAVVRLTKRTAARERVEEDPDVRSGMPGTRVGVHEAADALAGDGLAAALKRLPSLCRAGLEAPALFAQVHPRTRRPRSRRDGRRLTDRQIAEVWKHAGAAAEGRPLACSSPRIRLEPNGRQQVRGDDG